MKKKSTNQRKKYLYPTNYGLFRIIDVFVHLNSYDIFVLLLKI